MISLNPFRPAKPGDLPGMYGLMGLGVYFGWYQMGAKRGFPYIALGGTMLALSYVFVPSLVSACFPLLDILFIDQSND